MPNIEVELTGDVEFEVYCSCGNGICANTRVSYNRGRNQVMVEPCEKCLAQARNEGYDEGYDEGLKDEA